MSIIPALESRYFLPRSRFSLRMFSLMQFRSSIGNHRAVVSGRAGIFIQPSEQKAETEFTQKIQFES
jgi:hypothetical protein